MWGARLRAKHSARLLANWRVSKGARLPASLGAKKYARGSARLRVSSGAKPGAKHTAKKLANLLASKHANLRVLGIAKRSVRRRRSVPVKLTARQFVRDLTVRACQVARCSVKTRAKIIRVRLGVRLAVRGAVRLSVRLRVSKTAKILASRSASTLAS